VTRAETKQKFSALLGTWRELPENRSITEQNLQFSSFLNWLEAHYPAATKFRSRMGASYDLEQWFDFATHQSWRN
jgi:hypothetical protein